MWRRFRIDASAKPVTSEEYPGLPHVILRELKMWLAVLPDGWHIVYQSPDVLLAHTSVVEHLWLYIKEPD